MALLRVLAFDHGGRVVQFNTWLDDLELCLLSDIKDGVSLFDHVSNAATTPPTTADSATRSQWLSRDAAARLAICNHLSLAECAHFGQHRSAQALYDAVVARYSSPTTAALGHLLLPYLFPELSAFTIVEDLVSHLRASDARYCAAVLAEFLDRNQPPMFITLYFIVTRLPDSLRSVRDHFLSLDPTSLTVDLLEQHLLVAETSAIAVGAASAAAAASERDPVAPAASIDIFDLDFDAILSAMYALSVSAEGDCYWCVPPDPGIAAAALGASECGTLPSTAPAQALHTFMLDSGASACFFRDNTTLTPLSTPVPIQLADPSGGPEVAVPPLSSRVWRFSPAHCQVAASCSCRLLSHQTLLWHHRLGHPSLPRLRGMHSRLLVSGLPMSLPPLRPSPAPPCLPCVEGRQRAAPHSSSFPPRTAPLRTLHMDVWGPARKSGQSRERYFLLVVDDYTRYTTVFPLRSKAQIVDVLIPWIRTFRVQLHERFSQDLPVQRLHSDRGGEFSSSLLRDFVVGRAFSSLMEVARTSMIHAAASHFLWPFAVRYAAHQLNLWPHVSLPETSPTLRWMGKVGDASEFRVWGSRAFVRDTSADKLSPRAIPCGPAPSRVSQVDPLPGPALVQVVVGSGAAQGAASGGAGPGGAESEGAETVGAELGGLEPGGGEPGGAEPEGVELGGSAGALPGLSLQQLQEWFVRRARLRAEATAAGGAGVTAGAGVPGGTAGAGAGDPTESGATGSGDGGAGAGGAGVGGTGAGGAGVGGPGVGGAGAVDPGGAVRPRPYFVPLLQQPASPLPAPSPYTEISGGLTERREPVSRPVLPVCAAHRVPRTLPPPVPGTHAMTLRPSSVPLRVHLPAPPESSLPEVPDPECDRARAASPIVSRLLATAVADPSFESAAASALVAKLLDFAATCRLDYATALVAESASASAPSVGGECALGTDVLEDRQEDFECLAAAAAMDAEMASLKSTSTYVDEVSPPGANIVNVMWIFRVKRPPGSPPLFKARYVARGFSQLQGGDYFKIFSPTPKMTTLRVLLHVAAQHEYKLHSLTTLVALGFAPSTADPSLFLRTDTLLPLFYVLVYVDDLVFAMADTEALTLVKSELQKSLTCTDLGELRSYLGLQITRDRARRTITLTQSHMVHQVLQRFGFQFSSTQLTPLSSSHSLSARPSDESVEPSGRYPELVGCLMYLMTCTRPDLEYPLSLLARYVAPGRHQKVHWDAAKRVLRYLCSTLGMGLVLGGRGPVVLTGHSDASWVDDLATQRSSQGYTFSLGSGSVSWRSTRASSVLNSSCEAKIYAGAMAAQELRWLTYLQIDLGEQPCSPPVLFIDNKAMIA
ncbi:unnamed protein product [Closterium sp. NIES-54]